MPPNREENLPELTNYKEQDKNYILNLLDDTFEAFKEEINAKFPNRKKLTPQEQNAIWSYYLNAAIDKHNNEKAEKVIMNLLVKDKTRNNLKVVFRKEE